MLNYCNINSISKCTIQNMRYCRNSAKTGLKLSQYKVATSINSRFCSVVETKLSFFLKGGQLLRSGSIQNQY